ncbi:MAG: type II secretion system protein, partial [Planctomycetota bacterium]
MPRQRLSTRRRLRLPSRGAREGQGTRSRPGVPSWRPRRRGGRERYSPRLAGFTLIELLVVMSIIAIIAAYIS